MNGTLKTDRRYSLGDYKYTTMEDIIDGISENLLINPEFMSQLRFLQLVGFEIAYRRYIKLMSTYPHTTTNLDIAIAELEKLRDTEIKKLKIIMNGKSIEDTPLEE